MIPSFVLLLLAAGQFDRPAIPDAELAEQRGGFRLPGGLDVALTVDTMTAINGAVVLRTVFRADQGAPSLAIYAPKPGEVVAAPASRGSVSGTAETPAGTTVTYDARNGIQISTASGVPAAAVGAQSVPTPLQAGLQAVAGGTATGLGTVTEAAQDGLRRVTLAGSDLSITHLAGSAFGAAITNMADDRAIDTQTSVAIDLSRAGPDVIGSAMLRAQDVTAEALRGRF